VGQSQKATGGVIKISYQTRYDVSNNLTSIEFRTDRSFAAYIPDVYHP
jgi:hypothetical protein